MKRPRLLSLRELRRVPRWCPDSEVRKHSPRPLSELRNRKDTSNIMILVPLLNPKFATVPAAKSCELRVRGTRAFSAEAVPASTWKMRPNIEPGRRAEISRAYVQSGPDDS